MLFKSCYFENIHFQTKTISMKTIFVAVIFIECIVALTHYWLFLGNVPVEHEWRRLTYNQISGLSKLGRILFMGDPYPAPLEKTCTILVWKFGTFLERRHIRRFDNVKRYDPFEGCSVKNCIITYDEAALPTADAVVFLLHRTKSLQDLPIGTYDRPAKQRWVFLSDESPKNTFLFGFKNVAGLNGIFNWSMTYRMDADVPVPYGRAVKVKFAPTEIDNIYSNLKKALLQKTIPIGILISNCGKTSPRWRYLKKLQKYIKIDVLGNCGDNTDACPGHFNQDCDYLQKYKFYLAFENTNCEEYITEKLWWNAYAKNIVPVVMGASNLRQLLPPNSYINADEYTVEELSEYLQLLDKTPELYMDYFDWKTEYDILNEHGYFQSKSVHYCRLCEALNYNSQEPKIYERVDLYLSDNRCRPLILK